MKPRHKFIFILILHNGIYIFLAVLFWILSTSYKFSFNLLERRIFNFLSDLFMILWVPNCIILAILIRKVYPSFHEQGKQFYKDIKSVKKIQKIGLVIAVSGVAFFIVSLILTFYNLIFIDSIYLEDLFDFFYYLSLAVALGGILIFVLFFGKKKMKAKSWRELIDGD